MTKNWESDLNNKSFSLPVWSRYRGSKIALCPLIFIFTRIHVNIILNVASLPSFLGGGGFGMNCNPQNLSSEVMNNSD